MYYWRNKVRKLDGYTTILCIIEFPKALKIKGMKVLYPSQEDFDESVKIAVDLLKQGTPISSIDIIIAAMALNRDLTLITMDSDFKYIQSIRPKFKVKLIE